MDADLYDEFGNYIGPDLESDSEEEEFDEPDVDVRFRFVCFLFTFVKRLTKMPLKCGNLHNISLIIV